MSLNDPEMDTRGLGRATFSLRPSQTEGVHSVKHKRVTRTITVFKVVPKRDYEICTKKERCFSSTMMAYVVNINFALHVK